MPTRAWHRLAIAVLVICLDFGCERNAPGRQPPADEVPMAPERTAEAIAHQGGNMKPLPVFADEPFYLQRKEPEEVLVGVLRAAAVREGPDTRDMPFKLLIGEDEFSVYTSGFDEETLRPYVGHEVEIVGKRIDQTKEGYGIEIWIATISMR